MAVDKSYNVTFAKLPSMVRRKFDVETWDKTTAGGLTNRDRTSWEIYGEANSVLNTDLENLLALLITWGKPIRRDRLGCCLGRQCRDTAATFGFICRCWRNFNVGAQKKIWPRMFLIIGNPAISEPQPFDVYMVD
jgi:hypothetical protein